jgi:NAD+ kinase
MRVAVAQQPHREVADRLTETIAAIDGLSRVDRASADLLLAVDDDALRAAVDSDDDRPRLRLAATAGDTPPTPAEPSPTTDGTAPTDHAALLSQLSAYSATTVPTTTRSVVSIQVGDTASRAVRDCAIVTTDPARISEYRAVADDATLTAFRADGVVVATPLGTAGYSRGAGGPRLAPDTGLAVVPIAPFAMTAEQWVVSPPLTLRVEREDDVAVFADGRRVTSGGGGLTVAVSLAGSLTVVDRRRLAEHGRNWKNSNESSSHE